MYLLIENGFTPCVLVSEPRKLGHFLTLIFRHTGRIPLKQPSEEQYVCQDKMQMIK